MPIYEYHCQKCGATTEFLTGQSKDERIICQGCGSLEMERIMSAPSFISKAMERAPGHTCCGRGERCETPPCSSGSTCRRD